MRAANAPSTPQIRLHPDTAAVEVQALFRGIVIGARCLTPEDAAAFLIGCAKGVDAPAAANLLPSDAHPLVTHDAAGFAVELTEQMKGTVIFEDRAAPLDELLRAGPFTPPPAARLQIACGDVAFLVGTTARPPEVPRPALARLEDHWPWLVAAAGGLLMMLLVSYLPPDMMSLSGELDPDTRRLLPTVFVPPMPPPAPTVARGPAGGAPKSGGGGTGSPTRRPQTVRRPTRPRGTAPEDIAHQGLVGALLAFTHSGSDSLAIFSSDDKLQVGSFEGMVDGSGTGPGGTGFGLGATGTGAGPGTGPLIGDGSGKRMGICDAECQGRAIAALRGPGGGLRRHIARAPDVIPVEAKVRGRLDKDIIRRAIRLHLGEVKFCYEKELVRHPALGGRVAVQFAIGPNGRVLSSVLQSSTVKNSPVENCIVEAVRRWDFPSPEGGGMTIVSYPFVLVPAGEP